MREFMRISLLGLLIFCGLFTNANAAVDANIVLDHIVGPLGNTVSTGTV